MWEEFIKIYACPEIVIKYSYTRPISDLTVGNKIPDEPRCRESSRTGKTGTACQLPGVEKAEECGPL
jgi:hypothetical protein